MPTFYDQPRVNNMTQCVARIESVQSTYCNGTKNRGKTGPKQHGADIVSCSLFPQDILWALWTFVGCLVIRAIVLFLLYPCLKGLHRCGYGAPVTWQNAVFMWWAGLRGAVGLALGIQFYRSQVGKGGAIDERGFKLAEDAAQMLFHITFVAMMTLLVCAPSGEALLRHLKLIGETEVVKVRSYC